MTGPEVTAAMKAEGVPKALVERMAAAICPNSRPEHKGVTYCIGCFKRAGEGLAAVLPEAYAEAIEHVAKRISPNSGIGLADGATRGDVAVWLLEYAAALRAKGGEGAS